MSKSNRVSGANMWGLPDDLAIETIAMIEDPQANYSFDNFWIFKHKASGRIFYGQDSGCSCPTPFEDDYWGGPDDTSFIEVVKGPTDTQRSLKASLEYLQQELNDHCGDKDEKLKAWGQVKGLLT
jgi:hypothetical protein